MTTSRAEPDIDAAVREAFASVPGVVAVYVYGSAARGRLRPDSDVDIGVVFDSASPAGNERAEVLASIAACLERSLGRAIDIVELDQAPVVLRWQAIARGRRILETDRKASRNFVARTLIEYWDLQPTLALFDRALDRRLGVKRDADGRP